MAEKQVKFRVRTGCLVRYQGKPYGAALGPDELVVPESLARRWQDGSVGRIVGDAE